MEKKSVNCFHVTILGLLLFSCVDIDDWGRKRERAIPTDTAELLRRAINGDAGDKSTTGGIAGTLTSYSVEPGLYVQYFAQTQYPDLSLYKTTRLEWDDYYTKALKALHLIIQLNSDRTSREAVARYGANVNQIAVASILKVYYYWHVTDRWGDVPYFNALTDSPTPSYDHQKKIYYDFFDQLKEANEKMLMSEAPPSGDVLFQGDLARWRMFSNSLRMLMAIRLSEADPDRAKAEFSDAFHDPGGFVDIPEDNIVLHHSEGSFENSWSTLFDQKDEIAVSDKLISTLVAMKDPRVGGFAALNNLAEYRGLPYGLTSDSLIRWITHHRYSSLNARITDRNFPGYIITSSQIHLAVCEAILRQWIDGDPVKAYNIAIHHSFRQWTDYHEGTYTDYISQPQVRINSGTFEERLSKIALQRWIALFPNGFQAWAEWRRTGYPELVPTSYAINSSKQIPRRYAYPQSEIVLNYANYLRAQKSLPLGDTHDSRVWWDVPR